VTTAGAGTSATGASEPAPLWAGRQGLAPSASGGYGRSRGRCGYSAPRLPHAVRIFEGSRREPDEAELSAPAHGIAA
jgi:hypothetical protein